MKNFEIKKTKCRNILEIGAWEGKNCSLFFLFSIFIYSLDISLNLTRLKLRELREFYVINQI